ncbi:nuclear nucleic acid-binding protein C1D-like [Rhopilema esculentum]|uniref:nuclear nucleic acid-binding protein C1D-like n=1 Tax=Rhopilema esculentum TaxID=499914 RepID=UPI0031D20CE3
MAAEEELPPDLREEMLKLESSLGNFGDLLKRLTKQPLLDTKNKLSSIENAKLDLTTTYAINSLFWIYLVTQGINATDHQVKDELNRVKAYMSKIKSTEEKEKQVAKLRIDKEAAKRFVKSALWTEQEKPEAESKSNSPPADVEEKKDSSKRKKEGEPKKKKKKKKLKQD